MAEKIPFLNDIDVKGNADVAGNLHVIGNITTAGYVDGVDLGAFKAAYDSHNHDSSYVPRAELEAGYVTEADFAGHTHDIGGELSGYVTLAAFNAHNHDDAYLSRSGGVIDGSLDVEGKIYDKDGADNERNVSDTLDLLLSTTPDPFDALSLIYNTFGFHSGRVAEATVDGYFYTDHSFDEDITAVVSGLSRYTIADSFELHQANRGILTSYINGAFHDSIDLTEYSPDGSVGTALPAAGYDPDHIKITVMEKHSYYRGTPWFDIPAEYTRAEASLDIPASALRKGSNRIRVEHTDGVDTIGIAEIILFYDAYDTRQEIVNTSITINTLSNLRYLSGIPFAGSNSSIDVAFTVENFFGGTFNTGKSIYIYNEAAEVDRQLDYSNGSGYDTPPGIGQSVQINETFILNPTGPWVTRDLQIRLTADSNNSARSSDVIDIGDSAPLRALFGTSQSGLILEDHLTENYRIPAASLDDYKTVPMDNLPLALFNSNNTLGSDELQIDGGVLIYPHIDYSGHQPVGLDYSVLTGIRQYGRPFGGFLPSAMGGQLKLTGITAEDIANDRVIIEICIPGVTAWGSLKEQYISPVDEDGLGCWHPGTGNGSDGTFGFFMGHAFSEGGSAFAILLRITISEAYKDVIEIGTISVQDAQPDYNNGSGADSANTEYETFYLTNTQVVFELTKQPRLETLRMVVNGISQRLAADFSVNGSQVTWISPDFATEADDFIEFHYETI